MPDRLALWPEEPTSPQHTLLSSLRALLVEMGPAMIWKGAMKSGNRKKEEPYWIETRPFRLCVIEKGQILAKGPRRGKVRGLGLVLEVAVLLFLVSFVVYELEISE
jgi:hypothetical protein